MNPSSDIQQQYNKNFRVETGIGPVTDNIFNVILDKLNTDQFKEKITDKIFDPITDIINKKLKPYVHIGIGAYLVIIILLLVIIYLLVSRKK